MLCFFLFTQFSSLHFFYQFCSKKMSLDAIFTQKMTTWELRPWEKKNRKFQPKLQLSFYEIIRSFRKKSLPDVGGTLKKGPPITFVSNNWAFSMPFLPAECSGIFSPQIPHIVKILWLGNFKFITFFVLFSQSLYANLCMRSAYNIPSPYSTSQSAPNILKNRAPCFSKIWAPCF